MRIQDIFLGNGFLAKCNVQGVTVFWNILLVLVLVATICMTFFSWWFFGEVMSIGDSEIKKEYRAPIKVELLNTVIKVYREKKLKFDSFKR